MRVARAGKARWDARVRLRVLDQELVAIPAQVRPILGGKREGASYEVDVGIAESDDHWTSVGRQGQPLNQAVDKRFWSVPLILHGRLL